MMICLFSSCNGGDSSSESPDSSANDYSGLLEGYEKSCSVTEFADDDIAKVNIKATFDVSECTADAKMIITPYPMFGNGMCLQRDAVNKIWGYIAGTEECEHIAVSFRGKVYYGTVKNSEWEVYLPKMTAGGPFEMTLICDLGRRTLTDVYVGEVYLLSGQSNMEWKTGWSENVLSDLYSDKDECKNDRIRMVSLSVNYQDEPSKTFAANPKWLGANVSSIKNFSAVGYIFGKEMERKLDCPVGLVCNAVGGSLIEFWMDKKTLSDYEENCKTVYNPSLPTLTPNKGFNGLIYPLEGLNFRGVCWYQGCSNTNGTQRYYNKALRTLIASWRKFFNNNNLTFSIAELARYSADPAAYSVINERIGMVAAKDPLVCKAINLDKGEWNDIHPKDKHAIGTRLASETLRNFYGKDENAAPEVLSYEIVSDKEVKLVMSENVVLKNGSNGFEVFTASGYSFDCSVTVDKNIITVTSQHAFSGVRYGYVFEITDEIKADVSKTVTIFDKQGLPCDLFVVNFEC